MQDTRATNPVSPTYGSTTNPMQSGIENCVELDGQSSQQSEHEYINLDDETVPTQDTNEDPGERDIGNNNGKDELKLKSKCQKTSKVLGDFIQVTLPDGKKVKCIHCKKRLAFNSTGTTTTWARHMKSSMQRKHYLRCKRCGGTLSN
nr:hypothetical protein [Tanacetum cinerariifolium]